MKVTDCYELGEVIKTHGLKGGVNIFLDVDLPEQYEELESVFLLIEGKLIPFFLEQIQINGSKALVKFEGVDTIDDANKITKKKLFLPLRTLPDLGAENYYFHQLIGCRLIDNEVEIGEVLEYINLPGNPLLAVQRQNSEVLIPFKDEFILKVDIEKKEILSTLPDGLISINEG